MSAVPRVLLLGDSIRMGYQPQVTVTLQDGGEAVVTGPQENCQYSAYTRERLPVWIDELGVPDVVHWNNGLHDVGHNPARDPVQFPVEAYVGNLAAILDALQEAGARIIWATSTPVHPDRPFRNDGWSWRNEEIDRYNAAALELIRGEGLPVNDLHALVSSDVDRYLAEDLLHLSADGIRTCAAAVADAIRAAL